MMELEDIQSSFVDTDLLWFLDSLPSINRSASVGIDYSAVTHLQEALIENDALFQANFPKEFESIRAQVENVRQRWEEAHRNAVLIEKILRENHLLSNTSITFRAKSLWGTAKKAERAGHSVSQIYDMVGVRIVTTDESSETQLDHAKRIKLAILHSGMFQPIEPEEFPSRPGYKGGVPIQDPITDTFSKDDIGFSRVRLNLRRITKQEPLQLGLATEFQVVTGETIKQLNLNDRITAPWKQSGVYRR